jgi:hypothetical protein
MYVGLKGSDAIAIHNNLLATLMGEEKLYSPVMYYLRKPGFSSPKTAQPSGSPAPILYESDEAILLALSEEPFASVRPLARRIHLYPSTVYNHITHKLGSPFDIFAGSHIFCRKLTNTPEYNFHFNHSRCSGTRKTGCSMAL